MTTRVRNNNMTIRIETELEKNREEQNWAKVTELAEQLRDKSPNFEYLSDFLIGEGKLEKYLEEWPPIEANIHRAKLGLIEAKRYLQLASNEAGKQAGVALDANLLLGKLNYCCGQYAESLNSFQLAELDSLSEKKLPIRSLRIVAESFAIKALCLAKDNSASSKFKKAEREEEMNKSFATASNLSLLYMQEFDKQQMSVSSVTGTHSPLPPPLNKTLSPIMEQALLDAPTHLVKQNKPVLALERFRSTLSAVESQSVHTVRLKLMCQMAELLLQGMIDKGYKPPLERPQKESPWKPKQYNNLNQFVPKNEQEEILLVLLIAESIAVRHAVLSQFPEFKEARNNSLQDAFFIYDLLTLATVRWGQVSLLQESLERAMKFSFEEPYVWRQHALSLIACGSHKQALNTLVEVIRIDPTKSINCLLAARLCFEHLENPVVGTNYSLDAMKKELLHPSGLLGRCHLYIGIGYHLQQTLSMFKQEKQKLNELAFEHLQLAVQLEPNDHLCHYYLSLHLANNEKMEEALYYANIAQTLRPENSAILHLTALLLSAKREYAEALDMVATALEEYPDCLNLMYLKAHLELNEDNGDSALTTARQMLELWKTLYEGQTTSDVPECDRKSDTRSVFQLYTSEMSDKDSSSLQTHSVAASKVEQALSEVASSMSSFSPRPGPQRAWLLLMEIWLLLAEIYLNLNQLADAQQCIQEATQIFALSHHIMHMKGLVHMHKKEWTEAKNCFQNAVAINPNHIKSLQQLGMVYHYMDCQGLAEATLRNAAKIEPSNHITWYNLGKVLESINEFEKASSCMATALDVEAKNPILPFDTVPLCFE
ncbi:tetratricopeptide repeat protein 7B [Agrilus planipennis]|uniref:Tetratricopeptide repeat protein 7B n=1 Tax=Agrilus planipennis TaxID=224129 RepID=A0A1W4WQA8_AGRPL|nr:tetratricopeptide repeat protein 7B [Agrilus planipennis]